MTLKPQDAFPRGLGVGIDRNVKNHPPVTIDKCYTMLNKMRNASWWYDWGWATEGEPYPKHPEWGPRYVPMMWRGWNDKIRSNAKPHGKALLCLNEPDVPGQADMTPHEAKAHVLSAKNAGFRLVAPGLNLSGNDPYVYGWLHRYVKYGGPIPEAWHIHIYPQPATFDTYKRQVGVFRDWMYKLNVARPIFVTEISGRWAPVNEQIRLLNAIKLDLEKQWPVAESVAWFSTVSTVFGPNGNLFYSDFRTLKRLGEAFAE
jgi:hypothetical protein